MNVEKEARRSSWAYTVNEFKKSGLTQADFCKNNNLNLKQFNYWFRKFKHEDQSISNEHPLQWVKLECEEIVQQKTPVKSQPAALTLKIGEVAIEVQNGFDSQLLVQVINTLRSIC